jgi:cell division protein FtsW
MYFLSGANIMHFVALIPSIILGVIFLIISSPYRLKRLITYFNPSQDPLGSSYHIRQILIALGTGGLTGVGLGSSLQKYQYLPEATTDSIFAIIGEEFGFLGSLALIMVFIFFLFRILKIIKNTQDTYSYLLGSGILVYFGCQIAVNLGAIVAILPLTGVPLPFISFGSSNLVISLAAVGILINISKSYQKNHKLYG